MKSPGIDPRRVAGQQQPPPLQLEEEPHILIQWFLWFFETIKECVVGMCWDQNRQVEVINPAEQADRIQGLERQLEQVRNAGLETAENLQLRIQQLQTQLEGTEKARLVAEGALPNLRQTNEELRLGIEKIRAEGIEIAHAIPGLQQKAAALKSLQTQHSELQARYEQVLANYETFQKQGSVQNSLPDELDENKERESSARLITRGEREIERLREKITNLEGECNHFREHYAFEQSHAEELQRTLRDRSEALLKVKEVFDELVDDITDGNAIESVEEEDAITQDVLNELDQIEPDSPAAPQD